MKFPIYELSRGQFSGWIIAKYHLEAIRRAETSTVTEVPERSTAAIEQPTLLQPRSTGLWLLPWFVPPRY